MAFDAITWILLFYLFLQGAKAAHRIKHLEGAVVRLHDALQTTKKILDHLGEDVYK